MLDRERALRDNAQWGEWEEDDLAALLKSMGDDGSNLDLLGFDDRSLQQLLDRLHREGGKTDPDDVPPHDGVVYDVPQWKEAKVHPDHHISFGQALYSAPATTCPPGTKVEVRGDRTLVRLYKKRELMKVHPRQPKGGRATDPEDYPAEKTTYALRAPDRIVAQAAVLGPNVERFAQRLFEGPLPWAKLRAGQKLISLGERYGGERLDAACQRTLAYDLVDVRRLQRILLQALDRESPPVEDRGLPLGSRFARPGSAFDHRQLVLQEATR